MGKLIATTQATVDGVIDPVGEWVQEQAGSYGDRPVDGRFRVTLIVLTARSPARI